MVRVHAKSEGCGRAALMLGYSEPVVCESSITLIRAKDEEIDPFILLHWLYHPPIRHIMTSKTQGSLQKYIRKADILSLPCPLVPLRERAEIVHELRALDGAVASEIGRLAQVIARRESSGATSLECVELRAEIQPRRALK